MDSKMNLLHGKPKSVKTAPDKIKRKLLHNKEKTVHGKVELLAVK